MTDAPNAPGPELEVPAVAPPVGPATSSSPPGEVTEALAPGPASASPYRTPVAVDARAPFVALRRPSLPGAVVFVFGVLLWAFVVMGELTTSYGPGRHGMLVGEALAVVFVFATTAAAWRVALLRSFEATPPASTMAGTLRSGLVAVLSFGLWLVVLFCATALGKSASHDIDGPITTLLLIVSVGAALGGRRLAGLRARPATARQRWVVRVLWVCAGLLTFVATVEILAS